MKKIDGVISVFDLTDAANSATVNARLDTLEGMATNNMALVGAIDTRVGNNETDIGALDTLTTNTAALSVENASAVSAHTTALTATTELLTGMQTSITLLANQLGVDVVTGTIHDSLVAVVAQVDTMHKRLNSLFLV
jgi:hypothetical protein